MVLGLRSASGAKKRKKLRAMVGKKPPDRQGGGFGQTGGPARLRRENRRADRSTDGEPLPCKWVGAKRKKKTRKSPGKHGTLLSTAVAEKGVAVCGIPLLGRREPPGKFARLIVIIIANSTAFPLNH